MNDLKPLHKTVIACVFLGAIVVLQLKGQDTATFITVGLLLLGITGYSVAKIEAVQKQTNGGQEKLIQVIKENSERQTELIKLVASLPPAPVTEVKTIDGEVKPNEDEFVGSSR